ncbi:hypothetical protein HanIR_Chr04g0151091 [Helianthus annuus]|nr:hypothetical protein HanIR_Chr04g0151091 [Helianthus annuus]
MNTFRGFKSLFCASSFARCCLLRRMALYCFALTYMASPCEKSGGSGTRVDVMFIP